MEKRNIHLINELPIIQELEEMMDFCKKYENLYIYGRGENQEYLLKYFDMCGVKLDCYIVTAGGEREKADFLYRKTPVKELESLCLESTGIILGLSDHYYPEIMPIFHKKEFSDYFMMSEFNKRAIAKQMKPREREELGIEISLADHCNLSCQMCDHYSQLSDEWFVDMEQFKSDMIRMGQIFEHKIGCISLLGGEPTLHAHIVECIRITREQFPDAELIILTNGVKLLELENSANGNLWQACRDYDVHITVTVYPINLDYKAIERKAEEYGVTLAMSSDIHAKEATTVVKISDKHTMDLNGQIEKFYCVNCLYYNKFSVLKDGRIYMCPIAAHSNIFNQFFKQNLELKEDDFVDIYKIDSWKDVSAFSCTYSPFCSYCDLKHWGHHSEWKASTKKLEEYV